MKHLWWRIFQFEKFYALPIIKKSWTGSFSPERNLGNLSDWASKSAIGQIYLISEGLTREAGHHFRCMKHVANLWNTYGDALLSWKNFINSYMSKKKHSEECFSMMIRTGIEPVLPPWKGGVLTAWPTDHKYTKKKIRTNCGDRTWTCDLRVMSPASCQLLHPAIIIIIKGG